VRNIVLDCLRYWASEYHIDGFRFDLASIRGVTLAPNPPLLTLAFDPILAKCKPIAEAWALALPSWLSSAFGRWAEWNGKYATASASSSKWDGGRHGTAA